MLVLFFGLVVLCSVFFALGFKLGKSFAGPELNCRSLLLRLRHGRSAWRTASQRILLTPRRRQRDTPAAPAPADNTAKPTDTMPNRPLRPTQPIHGCSCSQRNYYVQVAAVSKQEDAEAWSTPSRRKQYAALPPRLAIS